MQKTQVFDILNQIYKNNMETQGSEIDEEEDNKVEIQTCHDFMSLHANQFQILTKPTSFKDFMQKQNQLITVSGTIVDMFEPEIEDVIYKGNDSTVYCMYKGLASDEFFQSMGDAQNMGVEYRDMNVMLVLLDLGHGKANEEPWSVLNEKQTKLRIESNKIPMLVRSFESRENYKIGQKIEISGVLDLDMPYEEQNDPESNNLSSYMDYYRRDRIFNMLTFNIKPFSFQQTLDNEQVKQVTDCFLSLLENVFGDKNAALAFVIGLVTRNHNKVGTESLEYLNINLFNMTQEIMDKLIEVLLQSDLDFQDLKVNATNLKENIISERDTQYGLMVLNQIYPGSSVNYLLSEFELSEGKLSEKATVNILKLKEMITQKQILVNFFQSIIRFDLNTSVIGLSKGKSIFPYDLKYKLNSQETGDNIMNIDVSLLAHLSDALDHLRERLRKIGIEDNEYIQGRYVDARKKDNKFNQHDFGCIIKLAKHIAVIKGLDLISNSTYDQAEEFWKRCQSN